MILTIGRTHREVGGERGVKIKSDVIKIKNRNDRGGRYIAAVMKNETQADIRAIRATVSPATMARRAREAPRRAFMGFIDFADRTFAAAAKGKTARKKRARKHLGKGYYANDTGRLADGLRVQWVIHGTSQEAYIVRGPPDRLQPRDFGTGNLDKFLDKLISLCPSLRDPLVMWERPKVQAAIAKALEWSTTVERFR